MIVPAASAYPAQTELLAAAPIFEWIDRNFLRHDPFAFAGAEFKEFAFLCSTEVDVDPNGVYCVGSGAVGLSLNPSKVADNVLKPFNEKSDLDIALISEIHFENAWRNLRVRGHPALNEIEIDFQKALVHQKKRFFDGVIMISKLLPYLDFGPTWIGPLTKISEFVCTELDREIEVRFWIYRDYWSLRSYIANSIHRCKESVL